MNEGGGIDGVRIWRPSVHRDGRGHLVEIFKGDVFVQANHSRSRAGALRGLHYHARQSDLWYVVGGRIQVGLADLRGGSGRPPTQMLLLDEARPTAIHIPPMVAHGYLALTDAEVVYFFTRVYERDDEFGIAWDDPSLGLAWEAHEPILSSRDRSNPRLQWDQIPRSR